MIDTPRISLVACVALAAGLVVACASPNKRPPTRRAAGPTADLVHEEGPATPSIAGVVHDDEGRPIPAVWIEVEGHPKPLTSPPAWRTDVHGRFQIDDIPPGPVKLLVRTGQWSVVKKKVVETRTGVRDLVIVLDPGPQLFLRIVGYVPASQVRWARATWEEADGTRALRYAPIRDDGWIRFVGLPLGQEFEVWAEAEVNRRYVCARDLKPGETEHRIEIDEGRDIAGRIQGSKARLDQRIAEAGGPLRERLRAVVFTRTPRSVRPFYDFRVADTRVRKDGSFRIQGLPPGTYEVEVGTGIGRVFWVSKIVEAGTTDAIFEID